MRKLLAASIMSVLFASTAYGAKFTINGTTYNVPIVVVKGENDDVEIQLKGSAGAMPKVYIKRPDGRDIFHVVSANPAPHHNTAPPAHIVNPPAHEQHPIPSQGTAGQRLHAACALRLPAGQFLRCDMSADLGVHSRPPMTVVPQNRKAHTVVIPFVTGARATDSGSFSYAFHGSTPRGYKVWISDKPAGEVYSKQCLRTGPEGTIAYRHNTPEHRYFCNLPHDRRIMFYNVKVEGCAAGKDCSTYVKIS